MESINEILNLSKTIIVYSYFMISLIGLFLNTIGFIVFSRKKFHNTVFSIYFRFMITIDTIGLLIPINRALEYNLSINFRYLSSLACKLRMYYANITHPISGWTLVVITIDRFLSISYPCRFHFRKKRVFQIFVCCVVILINTLFYMPFLLYDLEMVNKKSSSNNKTMNNNQTTAFKINNNISYYSCTSHLESFIYFLDLFEASVVPFLIMILFSSLTIRQLIQSRKTSSTKFKKQKDFRFAIVSIGLNIIFLVLTLPHYLFFLVTRFFKITNPFVFDFFNSIKFFMYYLNFISVFLINLAVNSTFRDELAILFRIKETNKKSNYLSEI